MTAISSTKLPKRQYNQYFVSVMYDFMQTAIRRGMIERITADAIIDITNAAGLSIKQTVFQEICGLTVCRCICAAIAAKTAAGGELTAALRAELGRGGLRLSTVLLLGIAAVILLLGLRSAVLLAVAVILLRLVVIVLRLSGGSRLLRSAVLLLAVAVILLLRIVVVVLRLSGGSRLLRSAVLLRVAGEGDGIIVIISVVSGSGFALFYIQALFLERRGADSTADGGPQSIGRGIVTDKITRIIGGGSTGIARIDYDKDHEYHEVAAKAIVLILLCLYGLFC